MTSFTESTGTSQELTLETPADIILLTEDDTNQGEYHKLTDDQKREISSDDRSIQFGVCRDTHILICMYSQLS